MKHTAVLIGALITSTTFGCSQSRNSGDAYERALRELASRDFSAAPERVHRKFAAIAAVWHRGRGNADEAFPYLLMHMRHHQDQWVRKHALATACSIATPADVPVITWEVRRQLDELIDAQTNADEPERKQLVEQTMKTSIWFVYFCTPLFPEEELPTLVELLTHIEMLAQRDCGVEEIPISRTKKRLPANETRSLRLVQCICEWAANDGDNGYWGNLNAVRPYLNDTVRSGLRAVVRESMEEGRTFNRMAAGILADWGDPEMLPIFKQLQKERGSDFAAYQIRKIELQNPPQGLIRLMRGDELFANSTIYWGIWALDRTLEIGLPREDILEAIQHYCSLDVDHPHWRYGATMVRSRAVALRLIEPTDIPEIPYFSKLAITQAQKDKCARIRKWIEQGPQHAVPPDCDYITKEAREKRRLLEVYYPPENRRSLRLIPSHGRHT